MRKELSFILFFLVFSVTFVTLIHAHLDAGQDINKDGYVIDFGYAPENISVGETTNFAFNLVNETNGNPINITSTWVRISLGDSVVFAGSMASKDANTAFTYVFNKPGDYTISSRFMNQDSVIEQQDFSIKVSNSKRGVTYFVLMAVAALVLLIVFNSLHKKR